MTIQQRETWEKMVTVASEVISVEEMYTLLKPTDKKKFFEIVDKISELRVDGYTKENFDINDFRMVAVKYLIEFESDKSSIFVPSTIQTSPWIPLDKNANPANPITNPIITWSTSTPTTTYNVNQ